MELKLEQVKKVVEEIKHRTAIPAYSLVINPDKKPDIFDSKFGGLPYWDIAKEYPKNSDGEPLLLLAQINFDKIQVENPLPDKGILQFYIQADDVYGMDFDSPDKQNTFRVIYHETVNYNISREEIEKLGVPDSTSNDYEAYSPVFVESAVDCVKKISYMGEEDYRFEHIFSDIVKEHLQVDLKGKSIYGILDREANKYINEELSNGSENSEGGHWLLGYPFFTQTDPREYEVNLREYDMLLFQMDSDYKGNKDLVLWGDCGVGNFFIRREDLEKKDFSRVLYNWDCC